MPHASYPANSVIACVDGSNQQPTVLEAASWAASHLVCSIGLLHAHDPARSGVASDFSGSLSAKARESLLDKLSKADAKSARELTEHGWDILESAKIQLKSASTAQNFTLHWHQSLERSMTQLQEDTALVVLGQNGSENSGKKIGHQVESAIKACSQPLLLTTPKFTAPKRALLAFDNRSGSQEALDWIGRYPLLFHTEIHVLMVADPTPKNEAKVREAVSALKQNGRRATGEVLPGKVINVIDCELSKGFDTLIMGAYGHSAIREWVLGSNTRELLQLNPGTCLCFRA